MNAEEALVALKTMLEETDENARSLTEERLEMLLADADGDVRRAAYQGALLKSRCSAVTLPDGVSLESNRDYWLTLARAYRTNRSCLAERE